jgi:hypothetical protein
MGHGYQVVIFFTNPLESGAITLRIGSTVQHLDFVSGIWNIAARRSADRTERGSAESTVIKKSLSEIDPALTSLGSLTGTRRGLFLYFFC